MQSGDQKPDNHAEPLPGNVRRTDASEPSSKRSPSTWLFGLGAIYLVGALIAYAMLGPAGSEPETTTIASGSAGESTAAVAASAPALAEATAPIEATPTPLRVLAALSPASEQAQPAPPDAATPTAAPTTTVVVPDPTATPEPAADAEDPEPTATPEPAAVTEDPEPTATPEPAAVTEDPEPTATAIQVAATATVMPTPVPTAAPTPAPAPTQVPTAAPAPTLVPTVAPVAELPSYSSGGTFTHVLVAKPTTARARIFDQPGGQELQVTYEYLNGDLALNDLVNPTHFGNPLSLRVLRGSPGDDWALVELPTRPNGQTGWVQTSPYDWTSSNHLVRINITTNTVTVWQGDVVLLETAAVTGKASSPTPVLTGYVDEKIYGLGGPYGPVLLSLGVFSNSLNTFGANGEAPKIALHGTNAPELMGEYASNGCIRVPNDVIQQISELVPVGSKVEIVR